MSSDENVALDLKMLSGEYVAEVTSQSKKRGNYVKSNNVCVNPKMSSDENLALDLKMSSGEYVAEVTRQKT